MYLLSSPSVHAGVFVYTPSAAGICGAFLPHVEKQVVSTFSSSSLKKYKCYVFSEVVEVSPTCSCFSIATLGNINV